MTRPTPAGLAHRPPRTPLESITPGTLVKNERFKPTYSRGLLLSGMTPEARLLGHTLLWYAHDRNGLITVERQPRLVDLAEATGLDSHRVETAQRILRSRGWLRLHPIQSGPLMGEQRFELVIPALYLQKVREARAQVQQLKAAQAEAS